MKAATLNYRDLIMIDGGYGPIGGQPPFVKKGYFRWFME